MYRPAWGFFVEKYTCMKLIFIQQFLFFVKKKQRAKWVRIYVIYLCIPLSISGTVTGTQACDVVATVDGVSKTLAGGYTYDQSLTPTITNVNPARGGTGGGSTLTITGTGFG